MGKSMRQSQGKDAAGQSSWVMRNVWGGDRPYYFNTARNAGINNLVSGDKPESLWTAAEKAKRTGEHVWVPSVSVMWQTAKVVQKNGDGSVVTAPELGGQVTVPASRVVAPSKETGPKPVKTPLWPVSWTQLEWTEDDIIKLDGINEASILYNLKHRYMQDKIYTWVGANGSVLLSINPYAKIEGLYAEKTMQLHKTAPHKPHHWAPPHVFTVFNTAYDSLREKKRTQSVLVTGESGSGKTEATKQMLEFAAEMIGGDSKEHHIAEKLLLSNPLLEAFGNAATLRNNNSSRFGKFIKVNFSEQSGKITGAAFINFMLETTRIVSHNGNERSFHVFYQLLQDEELRSGLGLGGIKDYAYLAGTKASLGVEDDAASFSRVKKALKAMEFSSGEVASVWSVLAGVLELGNLKFKDQIQKTSNVTGSEVLDARPLERAAQFLGVQVGDLRQAVTFRTVTARNETANVALDAVAGKDAADALSKAVYGMLFQLLVRRVNISMAAPSGTENAFFIGLLDIFGFEVLEINGFEQLCINYCNEKLQQYSNKHTFDSELAFYKQEGVAYEFLTPRDNQICVDVLDKKNPMGLMISLDDEGALPGGSDKGWLNKAERQFPNNPVFKFDLKQKFDDKLTFQIVHYAGEVKYTATNFVMKNKDTMWVSLYNLMQGSSDRLIQTMFPKGQYASNTKPIGSLFRANVSDLLALINTTETRFIRCIKPNGVMQGKTFDAPMVVDQLINSGVYETVEIRKGGYPFRMTHKQFAFQFKCINLKHKYQNGGKDYKALCAEIIGKNPDLSSKGEDLFIGKTCVLYRVSVHKPLVMRRNLAIEIMLPKAQAALRSSVGRYYAKRIRKADGTIQKGLDLGNDIKQLRAGFAEAEAVWAWLKPNLSYLPAYPMKRYNKGKALEKRLLAWEDLEAEMLKSTKGVQAAQVGVPLYKHLIDLCKRADTELADVKRTSAQAKLYELCQDLIHNSPPGLLDAEALPALKSLDRKRMQAVLDKAMQIGYLTEIVEKIKFILERLVFIDKESKEAVEVMDGARMKNVLDEANLYKYSNPYLKEIERLFRLEEEEFVKLELETAKRLGDKPREVHRRIRLKEIFYDKEGHKFKDTWGSGHARDPMAYAQAAGILGMCDRGGIARGMHSWSQRALPAPLTMMPGEVAGREETPEIRKLKTLCKRQFVNLQKYMGDKKCSAAEAEKAGQAVVAFGAETESKELRNELFLQIIKQLSDNKAVPVPGKMDPQGNQMYKRDPAKAENSLKKGYEMLGLCMSQFLPTDGFEDYLVMWVRANPGPGGDYRPYTSALHHLQFATDGQAAKVKPLGQLRKDFEAFTKEGSRYSVAATAFTGPTGAQAPKPFPKSPLDDIKHKSGPASKKEEKRKSGSKHKSGHSNKKKIDSDGPEEKRKESI